MPSENTNTQPINPAHELSLPQPMQLSDEELRQQGYDPATYWEGRQAFADQQQASAIDAERAASGVTDEQLIEQGYDPQTYWAGRLVYKQRKETSADPTEASQPAPETSDEPSDQALRDGALLARAAGYKPPKLVSKGGVIVTEKEYADMLGRRESGHDHK